VIVLLNTCGGYFSKGAAKRRLDRFLTFLQAYVLAKHTAPLDVDADLQVCVGRGVHASGGYTVALLSLEMGVGGGGVRWCNESSLYNG
jgi:hypothetical protein